MSACEFCSLLAICGPSYKTMVLPYKYNAASYVAEEDENTCTKLKRPHSRVAE